MQDYRAKQLECLWEAEHCHTEEMREVLLSIAKVWEALALEADVAHGVLGDTWAASPFWASDNNSRQRLCSTSGTPDLNLHADPALTANTPRLASVACPSSQATAFAIRAAGSPPRQR